jgi:2-iminobutanoate/2-iminopropanoate deaminase
VTPQAHVRQLNPDALGAPLAPYSQATVAGNLVFVAGQVALDAGNRIVAPGDAHEQTKVVLERIETILRELGGSLADVASATVYLTDLALFPAFDAGWVDMLGEHRPARATVRADLLLDGLVVEVQAVAVIEGPRCES